MLFCERCNVITDVNCCPACSNKKLRNVKDDDFCFFTKASAYDYEMFEFTLKENDIDVVGVPFYPNGVTYATAGRASGRRVYIRYRDIDAAKEIFEMLFGSGE